MKVSFHNHTKYSWDCLTSLSELERSCVRTGIRVLIITDHNEIDGALRAAQRFEHIKIIVGEEITTAEGEIVGIFLTDRIAPGLSLKETLAEIHRQGGLAAAVHPFDRLRKHVISEEALLAHVEDIDIVEHFNSRTVFRQDNDKARVFAERNEKPMIAGNDAHTVWEIGLSVMDMSDFSDAESFLQNLKQAECTCKRAPLSVHLITKIVKWSRRLGFVKLIRAQWKFQVKK